jgi:hypothetical protein
MVDLFQPLKEPIAYHRKGTEKALDKGQQELCQNELKQDMINLPREQYLRLLNTIRKNARGA